MPLQLLTYMRLSRLTDPAQLAMASLPCSLLPTPPGPHTFAIGHSLAADSICKEVFLLVQAMIIG